MAYQQKRFKGFLRIKLEMNGNKNLLGNCRFGAIFKQIFGRRKKQKPPIIKSVAHRFECYGLTANKRYVNPSQRAKNHFFVIPGI